MLSVIERSNFLIFPDNGLQIFVPQGLSRLFWNNESVQGAAFV